MLVKEQWLFIIFLFIFYLPNYSGSYSPSIDNLWLISFSNKSENFSVKLIIWTHDSIWELLVKSNLIISGFSLNKELIDVGIGTWTLMFLLSSSEQEIVISKKINILLNC